ncbi:hypothetical protein [Desulfosediminicola ganghwensis]|uniref:hypothetical protein n=1 Tax=Desulfosediminicola ganghwensis TaxID=2569540 RepID=UPI0010AD1C7C|nr:hypothetical protein [Desulfosediminicola ganghwensis]
MGFAEKVTFVVMNLCRIGIGMVMMYSGWELLRGTGLLSNTGYDSVLTALFVIGLGLYCIFRGGPAQLFELIQCRQEKAVSEK